MYNRTDGTPQDIFKKLGDAATRYIRSEDLITVRASNQAERVREDMFEVIEGLTLSKLKSICSKSVFEKTKRFEVKRSSIISTQVSKSGNWITGTYRAVKIYRQSISWGDKTGINVCQEYNRETLEVFCECKFFCKQGRYSGKCCKHIVGQMRRVIYIMNHDLEIHEQ